MAQEKLNTLIQRLQKIVKEKGNLPVFVVEENGYVRVDSTLEFEIEDNPLVDGPESGGRAVVIG